MSTNVHGFVEWKEQFVSQERGNRVVHYFLKDAAGDSVLAVVGTERSLRHMVYVVSEEFLQVYGSENSINACFKWRSRREVVDWLTSLLSKQHPPQDSSKSPINNSTQVIKSSNFSVNRLDARGIHLPDRAGRFSRKLKSQNPDIVWSGTAWTCGKQLKHYPAFCRNGTTIAIHSFVTVMAKEENHYLAYLEDMYEDKKGQKKVKVRWFHHNQEVMAVIPLPNPNPREVFITPYTQVISAECVDGPATILTPEHYEKCFASLLEISLARVHLCFREFRSNKIKSFDISKLLGYFDQFILSCSDPNLFLKHNLMCHGLTGEEEEEFSQGGAVRQEAKRTRSCRGCQGFVKNHSVKISGQRNQITACQPAYQNMKFRLSNRMPLAIKYVRPQAWLTAAFKVDEKIELLCQDSGIRGCWFRCTVLQTSRKQLKVQYDDVQNEDGCGNLKEWIPAFRPAAPDKLGMRCSGRLTIRPYPPPEDITDGAFKIGAPVDAWWSDGWWEGVVTEVDRGDDSLQVYFPGEDVFSTFQRSKLRSSRDWVLNRWVDIEAKPDILSVISAVVSPGMKFSACSTIARGAESGGSAMSDREGPSVSKFKMIEDKQKLAISAGSDDLLENAKWVNSKKQQWVGDEGKRGDGNDDDEYGHNEEENNDVNGDKLDMKEDLKCSAIELMEVAS